MLSPAYANINDSMMFHQAYCPPDLAKFLPKPQPNPDVKNLGDCYAVQFAIDEYDFLRPNFPDRDWDKYIASKVQYEWQRSYRMLLDHVLALFYGRDIYFTCKFYPIIFDREHRTRTLTFQLRVRVMASEVAYYQVPEFIPMVQDSLSAKDKVEYVEWRCGGCSVVNPMKNRTCDHCGTPRALLAQEMLKDEGLW